MKKILCSILSVFVSVLMICPIYADEENMSFTENHDLTPLSEKVNVIYEVTENVVTEIVTIEMNQDKIIEFKRLTYIDGYTSIIIKENGVQVEALNMLDGNYSMRLNEALSANLPAPICNLDDNTFTHIYLGSNRLVIDANTTAAALAGGATVIISFLALTFTLAPAVTLANLALGIYSVIEGMKPANTRVITNVYETYYKSSGMFYKYCHHVNIIPLDKNGNVISGANGGMHYYQADQIIVGTY